jgi:hypothetical protein
MSNESTETLDVKIRQKIGEGLFIGGFIILIIIVPLIVLVGILHWLKFKHWPDWSANAFGFYWQDTTWEGVNEIMRRLYHLYLVAFDADRCCCHWH